MSVLRIGVDHDGVEDAESLQLLAMRPVRRDLESDAPRTFTMTRRESARRRSPANGAASTAAATCPRRHVWCAAALVLVVASPTAASPDPPATLGGARLLFYNAQYDACASMALDVAPADGDEELARDELHASALLFQLRGLLESRPRDGADKNLAIARCGECGGLIAAFNAVTAHGQSLARTRLKADPADQTALFFLGKLNLNYLWLQLGPLRRRTGWDEYWEARRSLDAVLRANPQHVRARVARAWVDYIVDTKMPWGARWVLGGGDRKRALVAVRAAAATESDFFTHAEAEFALWDMLTRERQVGQAVAVAERLAGSFPDNSEVARFLEANRHRPEPGR